MRKFMKWSSKKAIETVSRHVQESPSNLQEAFTRAADELKTSQSAVSQAWYGGLRNKVKGFTVNSTSFKGVNTKNQKKVSVSTPIHESIVLTQKFDGMRVETIKRYFVA
jgi:hypothetical protein